MEVDQETGVKVVHKDLDKAIANASKVVTQQLVEIIIPSYAAWFSFGKIHEIEEKAVPEFFNNKNKSKTPQVYKDYRDFMINTYRLNPHEYLTVTACRRNLAGDVCAIIRVHAVLEQWGLLNYQVDPDSRPSTVGPAFTGHFRVSADTPRGLQPLAPSVSSVSHVIANTALSAYTHTDKEKLPKAPSSLSTNIYANKRASESDDKVSKKLKFTCGTCGVDCSDTRYHCNKQSNFDICGNCYLEGRFPSTLYSGDFLKMQDQVLHHDEDAEWSNQETLLLLEGIELFDDDWIKISEHVGTRTRDQCVLQFLKLPIEDSFVQTPQDKLGPLQYNRTPFSPADNPVLTLTSFLASLVSPKVAQAAAEAAVSKLKGEKGAPGSPKKSPTKTAPNENLEKAAATAFGAAAAKAAVLATHEELEMQKATRILIETQLKKMELKLQHFQEMEAILEHERKELETERHQFYLDRLELKKNGSFMEGQNQAVHPVENGDVEMGNGQLWKVMNLAGCLRELKKTGHAYQDEPTLKRFAKDQSYHRPVQPSCVYICQNERDIQTCLRICNEYKVPVIPTAGKTSLEGHTIPGSSNVVVIDTSEMDKIIAVNEKDLDCVVQPGVNWIELGSALEKLGLFFPPDPGASALIGGIYGTMKDNVVSLRVVLADGTVIKTRRRPNKSSAGYDLTRLFVGSEGTLGIVSEATLRLRRIHKCKAVIFAQYKTLQDAANTVAEVVQDGIQLNRMELLDDYSLKAINIAHKSNYGELNSLIFECAGYSKVQIQDQIEALEKITKRNNCLLFQKESGIKSVQLWNIRKAAYFASKALRPDIDSHILTTDCAVPISHLCEILTATRNDLSQHGLIAAIVAHAGDGNFHVLLQIDIHNESEVKAAEEFRLRNASLALKFDGTCTGEHGIGVGKRELLVQEVGYEAVSLMRKIKKQFDPNGILNPGKVFELEPKSKL
ncbi:hypothetical protein HDV01_007599 [Terramyces sp. JEL0728]|nr:hypothetical protein HDV01_007599 [Terramyces sp. JEL0728]